MKKFSKIIFLLFISFLGLIFFEVSMASQNTNEERIPSVGYFPASFPRDPVDVNIFLEHLLLGQVLEPLVETAPDGGIAPAVASSWSISKDSREIRFKIRKNLTFSNGKLVGAADVKYTLERHIQAKSSQSQAYLSRIDRIQASVLSNGDEELILHLTSPYIALFKALSRDQLGVVPIGWVFDPNSSEPFVGTGPYRVIREGGQWILKKNVHFREASNIAIPQWRIVIYDPKKQRLNDLALVDLVPFATEDMQIGIRHHHQFNTRGHTEENVLNFFQSSVWWYPHGKSFLDPSRRLLAARIMHELVRIRVQRLGLSRTTGIIPEGISGHLDNIPILKEGNTKNIKNLRLSIAVMGRDFSILNAPEDIQEIEKKHNVLIKMFEVTAPELASLPIKAPDLIVLSYAGGFQDPEGFLTVVTASLASDLSTIFQENYSLYQDASACLDWSKRTKIYQKLNFDLVQSGLVIPGWKISARRFRVPSLSTATNNLRYSPKLKDYQIRK